MHAPSSYRHRSRHLGAYEREGTYRAVPKSVAGSHLQATTRQSELPRRRSSRPEQLREAEAQVRRNLRHVQLSHRHSQVRSERPWGKRTEAPLQNAIAPTYAIYPPEPREDAIIDVDWVALDEPEASLLLLRSRLTRG